MFMSVFLCFCLCFLRMFFSLWHFIKQVEDISNDTKTVIGHNLQPTPWHVFPVREFKNETKLARGLLLFFLAFSFFNTRH